MTCRCVLVFPLNFALHQWYYMPYPHELEAC